LSRVFRLVRETQTWKTEENLKRLLFVLLSAFCLTCVACHGAIKKEVNAYIGKKDELILQIGKIIEANPTNDGVEEARKQFEVKKPDLKKERVELFQKDIPFEMTQMVMNSNVSDIHMLDAIRSKIQNPEAMENFTKLENEFSKEFHQ